MILIKLQQFMNDYSWPIDWQSWYVLLATTVTRPQIVFFMSGVKYQMWCVITK